MPDPILEVPETKLPRIVIVGGGFGGIKLAQKLRNKPFQVVMIDRNNFHTFQPLLYQVATGGLEPGSIAYPLRKVLRGGKNLYFRMAEVESVDHQSKVLYTSMGELKYDFLVIATGSATNFFGLSNISHLMMTLKSVNEALDMRSYILQNFEMEACIGKEDDDLLHIVIVGGGPTGVELAGAIGEMKKFVFPHDYPELDTNRMKITLIESGAEVLGPMSKQAQEKAYKFLQGFEVDIWLNTKVINYDGDTLFTDKDKVIKTKTVIWSAGVKGAIFQGLPPEALFGNRLKVNSFCKVEGVENIYAIGDVAVMPSESLPKGHPMLAPVAMQQAVTLAKNLQLNLKNSTLSPFIYKDQGSMATIGRNKAVVDLKYYKFQGFFAWFVWMFVHLMSLISFRSKIIVIWDWMYNYFTYDRALRLIIRPYFRKPQKVENNVP